MRKTLTMILILSLLLSLAACGGKEAEAPAAEAPTAPAAPAESEAPAAEAPAEENIDAGWSMTDGTLTIRGQGPMEDYELLSAPWDESGDSINVTKLVVEEGVSYLGANAFAACLNLAEVSLPKSLRGIGSFCFADCLALESVEFNSGLLFIGDSAFSGAGLKKLELPDGLASLGELSFTLCGALKSVRIPDSLCALGEDVFADCEALTTIELADGAAAEALLAAEGLEELFHYSGTAIPAADYPWSGSMDGGSWALQHGVLTLTGSAIPAFGTTDGTRAPWAPMASLITEVRAADGITSVGDYAFWGCSELSAVKLPAAVDYIGPYAFGACEALESFDFPASLDTIGEGAFSFCSALTEAVLPEGLTHIDDDAFQMCTALERMSLPASLTEIGSGALSFGAEEETEIVTEAGSYAEQWVKDNLS